MDPRFQSSFIPKKPIAMTSRPSRGPINILQLIAIVVFVISLVAAGAAFFYQSYLTQQIAADQKSLLLAKSQFDISTINKIIRDDSRLTNAYNLLKLHPALSSIFSALGQNTIQTVRFKSFTYNVDVKNTLTITMGGEAKSFADVAIQSQVFNNTKYFQNLVVSNLSVEPTGLVSFSIAMTVASSLTAFPPAGTTPPIPVATTSAPTVSVSTTTATSTNTTKP